MRPINATNIQTNTHVSLRPGTYIVEYIERAWEPGSIRTWIVDTKTQIGVLLEQLKHERNATLYENGVSIKKKKKS